MSKTASIATTRVALIDALSAANRIASSRVIPVLGSAHITATPDRVAWWVTDHDVWRGGSFAVDHAAPGTYLLPVAPVLAMLKSCSDEHVDLAWAKGRVALTSGRYSANVPTPNVEEFSRIPVVPDQAVTLPADVIRQMVSQVSDCVLPGGAPLSSSYMRGALLSVTADALTCVGLDGHRLARVVATRSPSAVEPTQSIVPLKSLIELGAMLDAFDGDVAYTEADGKHVFRAGDQVLVSGSISTAYPRYERMIPADHKTRVILPRDEWLASLKRVSLCSEKELSTIEVIVDAGAVTMEAQSADRGHAVETMPAETTGDAVMFRLKADYLMAAIRNATTDRVECRIGEPHLPICFAEVGSGGPDYLCVVQGMKR